MASPSPLRRHWWILVLGGALLFLAADNVRHLAAGRRVAAVAAATQPAPPLDEKSPTGQRWGERNQILDSTDGYHWVMQTQQMIANGEWRVRHVNYDNAPTGREVHWASPLHWWLAAVAWIDHAVSGRPWVVTVEHAATYATPWLLGIFLLGVVPLTARHFGAWPAALLAIGLVTVAPFSSESAAGSIDHHGIAGSLALLTVLFLLIGLKCDDNHSARRWFLLSGIAGAAGLWINAATQIPVLVGVGIGAVLATSPTGGSRPPDGFAARPEAALHQFDPAFWRTWGFAGGAASVFFYLIEYFPANFGLRLEVNHPLHALAWAGAGDLLSRICAWRQGRSEPRTKQSRIGLVASLAAVALPPLLALAWPQRTFVVADKFLWTLHVDYIEEFSPLLARLNGKSFGDALSIVLVHLNLLPLVALPAAWWRWRGQLAPAARAALALSLPPALLISFLAWGQVRWLHVSCALWLVVLVAMASTAAELRWTWGRKTAAAIFLAAIFLPYPVEAAIAAWRAAHNPGVVSRENLRQCIMRDFAYWLRRRTGGEAGVVLSGPTASTELIYHGGFKGIGTLYWENIDGLRTVVDIYGATTPAQALALLKQHGVSHLVIFPWGSFADESARLARGLRASDPVPAGAFARDLLESGHGMPDWVRPLVYRLPDTPEFKDDFVLVLEIVPDQSPADAAMRRAQFLAAYGNTQDAALLVRDVLAQNPSHLPALAMRAEFQRQARDQAGFRETMSRVQAALAGDPPPALEDRVLLALEFAVARDTAHASQQLAASWSIATEKDLRRLATPELSLLLQLTRDLHVSPDDPAKLALAAGLLAEEAPRPASRPR
ncbi:MAG TPA: STT3 domain-containing protein [Candidatus Didemnitutus sp.]|nr:STT3 domain-containing protein [Candidatus Didemnitutus sp.]